MSFQDFLKGTIFSASAIYLFDPSRGRRRRAFVREQAIHAAHKIANAGENTSRDLTNRLQGVFATAVGVFRGREADDEVLKERVRAQLGRYVSHPSSIEVHVQDGRAVLDGPILRDELEKTLHAVARVKGIYEVENRLRVYNEPGDVPGLQGSPSRREPRFELVQENWSPTARFLMGSLGAGLVVSGSRRRGWAGFPMGLAGTTLLLRALTNMPLKRLTGIDAKRRAIEFNKSLTIQAPVSRVFEFWSNFENFPRFMTHVREVRKTGAVNQWHWVVDGPAGVPVEWNAVVTQFIPNRVLAWRTDPDSLVQHAGIVHFSETQDGGTQIDIKFSYNPAAGAIGHAIAKLSGSDPKKQMTDDLVRMKTFLESGKVAHDAAQKNP